MYTGCCVYYILFLIHVIHVGFGFVMTNGEALHAPVQVGLENEEACNTGMTGLVANKRGLP
jgi:hypothetical protein